MFERSKPLYGDLKQTKVDQVRAWQTKAEPGTAGTDKYNTKGRLESQMVTQKVQKKCPKTAWKKCPKKR